MSVTKAKEIISELSRLGVQVEAVGERLRFTPKSAVPADLLDRMKAHKRELLAVLSGRLLEGPTAKTDKSPPGELLEAIEPPDPCPECGSLEMWWDIGERIHCMNCEPDGWRRSEELTQVVARLRTQAKEAAARGLKRPEAATESRRARGPANAF